MLVIHQHPLHLQRIPELPARHASLDVFRSRCGGWRFGAFDDPGEDGVAVGGTGGREGELNRGAHGPAPCRRDACRDLSWGPWTNRSHDPVPNEVVAV